MLLYGLLIYISFLFLKTRKEDKILNVILSKVLLSFSVCYIMVTIYLTCIMITEFAKFFKNFFSTNVATVFSTHIDSLNHIADALKQLEQPFFAMRFSSIFIIMYVVSIFTICIITFFKMKENKITLITTICLILSFIIFSFCKFTITCAIAIFIPQVIGLFCVILTLKELTPKKRKITNIKSGRGKFILCTVTLILVSLNLILNILWAIFGTHIIKNLLNLNINYI